VVLNGLNVPIGTGCTPLDIAGGVQCNTNTVNCGQVYSSQFSPVLALIDPHADMFASQARSSASTASRSSSTLEEQRGCQGGRRGIQLILNNMYTSCHTSKLLAIHNATVMNQHEPLC
jgi:hypothetical protein